MSYGIALAVVAAVFAASIAIRLSALSVLLVTVVASVLAFAAIPEVRLTFLQLNQLDTGTVPPPNTVRYQVKIVFSSNDGPITGSAIQQASLKNVGGTQLTAGLRYTYTVKGQAVTIPLADGSFLIALMRFPNDTTTTFDLFRRSCGFEMQPDETIDEYIRRVTAFRGTCSVSEDTTPVFLHLKDRSEPGSLELIDPRNTRLGLMLRDITITTTDDPPQTDILAALPWVRTLGRNSAVLKLSRTLGGLPISSVDFVRE